ncbi:hypothetical protein DPX16_21591 [Anabarilius grahami]|uniref:Uncharacterized protein n=1 Tax=Anabarilius grahami TaxID=495550 RepID=A0A3N0XH96_ANAGA|nr:hypothetical protein DPX16_21591 [Anabarilius grahami]
MDEPGPRTRSDGNIVFEAASSQESDQVRELTTSFVDERVSVDLPLPPHRSASSSAPSPLMSFSRPSTSPTCLVELPRVFRPSSPSRTEDPLSPPPASVPPAPPRAVDTSDPPWLFPPSSPPESTSHKASLGSHVPPAPPWSAIDLPALLARSGFTFPPPPPPSSVPPAQPLPSELPPPPRMLVAMAPPLSPGPTATRGLIISSAPSGSPSGLHLWLHLCWSSTGCCLPSSRLHQGSSHLQLCPEASPQLVSGPPPGFFYSWLHSGSSHLPHRHRQFHVPQTLFYFCLLHAHPQESCGLLKYPAASTSISSLSMDPAWCLVSLRQGNCTLEAHIQKFLEFAHLSDLPDCALIDFFSHGLNEPLKDYLLTNGPRGSFVEFLDFALLTVGSSFTVGVMEDSDTMVNPVMAATPKNTHKMATATTSHAFADRPEQRHAFADRPESRYISRSVRKRRGLRSSVADPPLISARAAGISKHPAAVSLSSQPAASLSSPVAASLSSPPDASLSSPPDASHLSSLVATHSRSPVATHSNSSVATHSNSSVATHSNSSVATHSNSSVATHSNSSVATHSSALDAMDKMAALPVPTGKTAAPSVLTEVGGVPAIESAPEPASASEAAPEPAPTGKPSPHPRKRRRRKKASSILRGSEAFQEAAGVYLRVGSLWVGTLQGRGHQRPPKCLWLLTSRGGPSHLTCRGCPNHLTCRGCPNHLTCRGCINHLTCCGCLSHLTRRGRQRLLTCRGYPGACIGDHGPAIAPMHPPSLSIRAFYVARTRLPEGGRYVTITVCSCHSPEYTSHNSPCQSHVHSTPITCRHIQPCTHSSLITTPSCSLLPGL